MELDDISAMINLDMVGQAASSWLLVRSRSVQMAGLSLMRLFVGSKRLSCASRSIQASPTLGVSSGTKQEGSERPFLLQLKATGS